MVAHQCGLEVGDFIWSGGDVHIYSNHMEQVHTQLEREPFELPQLVIKRKPDSIFDYTYDDFEFVGYQHHPTIKGIVAV
ncbi:Thymidylate synthase [compost metagenome]